MTDDKQICFHCKKLADETYPLSDSVLCGDCLLLVVNDLMAKYFAGKKLLIEANKTIAVQQEAISLLNRNPFNTLKTDLQDLKQKAEAISEGQVFEIDENLLK